MLLILYLLESGLPMGTTSPLFHREKGMTGISLVSLDFTNIPEEHKGLDGCLPSLGALWRTPRKPSSDPTFLVMKDPCRSCSQSPEINVLPFGRPTEDPMRVYKMIRAVRTGEQPCNSQDPLSSAKCLWFQRAQGSG